LTNLDQTLLKWSSDGLLKNFIRRSRLPTKMATIAKIKNSATKLTLKSSLKLRWQFESNFMVHAWSPFEMAVVAKKRTYCKYRLMRYLTTRNENCCWGM